MCHVKFTFSDLWFSTICVSFKNHKKFTKKLKNMTHCCFQRNHFFRKNRKAVFILHEERKKLQTFPAIPNEVDFWIFTLGFCFSKDPSQRLRTDGIQFLSTRQVFQSRVSFRLSVSSSPRCCQWHWSSSHPRPSRASSPTFSHPSRFPLLSSARESCNSRERVCRNDPNQVSTCRLASLLGETNVTSPPDRHTRCRRRVASHLVSFRLVSSPPPPPPAVVAVIGRSSRLA